MKKIILITGGQRSGKSTYAEKLAHQLTDRPVYLATAKIWDEEFRQRVLRHQQNRGPEWTNIEEEMELSKHNLEGRVGRNGIKQAQSGRKGYRDRLYHTLVH